MSIYELMDLLTVNRILTCLPDDEIEVLTSTMHTNGLIA